jgi:hypothetical protein
MLSFDGAINYTFTRALCPFQNYDANQADAKLRGRSPFFAGPRDFSVCPIGAMMIGPGPKNCINKRSSSILDLPSHRPDYRSWKIGAIFCAIEPVAAPGTECGGGSVPV